MTRRRGFVPVLAAVALIAACSGSGAADDTDLPVVLVSGAGDGYGMSAEVTGPVSVDDDGCVRVAGLLAVWPAGTSWDRERDALRLADGSVVRPGRWVRGGGGQTTGAVARTYLADARSGDPCTWESTVVLFGPGSDVSPA